MIEVSLALLVVSIGLMSLIGLIPASLDQGKKATDDSQMGLLAENLLSGYRSMLLVEGWNSSGNLEIPATADEVWSEDDQLSIELSNGQSTGELVYTYETDIDGFGNVRIEDLAARYDLIVGPHPVSTGELVSARLELRPGSVGPTNSIVFYTEIYNTDLSW